MKKNNIFFIALAIVLITFVGCKKDAKNLNEDAQIESNFSDLKSQENRSAYYAQLSAETNVDVVELASSDAVEQFFNIGISVGEEIIENAITGLTEYDIWLIEFYTSLLEEAIQEGDFELIEQRTNELLELLESLGLTNYWNIAVARIENPVMDRLIDESEIFLKYLDSEYPDFMTLSQDQQSDIFESLAEIYQTRQPVNECRNEALKMYGLNLSVATISFTINLAKCGLVGPGAPACMVGVSAKYAFAFGLATYQYNRALKFCN